MDFLNKTFFYYRIQKIRLNKNISYQKCLYVCWAIFLSLLYIHNLFMAYINTFLSIPLLYLNHIIQEETFYMGS